MITKEQAQAVLSEIDGCEIRKLWEVKWEVAEDLARTVIALHERVERMMGLIMEPVACHTDTDWLTRRSAILKETTND